MPNNRINADWQFRCASLPAGYAERYVCSGEKAAASWPNSGIEAAASSEK